MYVWVVGLYLCGLIGVSIFLMFRVRGGEDFIVAGRQLRARVLVGTLLATWIGAGSLFGGASLAYNRGLCAIWFSVGAWAGIFVLYVISGRVRRFEGFTVPDILEARYGVAARLLGTLTVVVAYTAITSYQFKAGGTILNLVTGLDVTTGIAATAVFVILYTALAGLLSVAYTDLINGIIMTLGLVLALPALISRAGGLAGVKAALPAQHLTLFGDMTPLEAFGYSLPALLLLLGESNMYQRFFSARDEATARRSVIGLAIGVVALESLIALLGIVGRALYPDLDQPQQVIPYAIQHALAPGIGALVLAATVAVVVSTADSFLLVPSTNVVRDIYQRFINPEASERRMLVASRLVVLMLGILAWVQVQFFESILEMAIYAYTVYGAGLTPAVLAAFFWRGASCLGGTASIAAGMVTTLAWETLVKPNGLHVWTLFGSEQVIESVYPALVASLTALFLLSLLVPGRRSPLVGSPVSQP